MSKSALLHISQSAAAHESLVKHTETDNACGATLSDLETRSRTVARVCAGCGCRFVPTGPQRYCEHACYSRSLRTPIEQRFWTKVNKTPTCWLWTASTVKGYGQISLNRKPVRAHRLAWELTNGPIPDGLEVLHKCDVPGCVRPDHLFLGSQQDNLADARDKGRLDERLPRTVTLTYQDRMDIYHHPGFRGVNVRLAERYGVTKTCIHHIRQGRFAGAPARRAKSPLDRLFERVPSVQLPIRGEVA